MVQQNRKQSSHQTKSKVQMPQQSHESRHENDPTTLRPLQKGIREGALFPFFSLRKLSRHFQHPLQVIALLSCLLLGVWPQLKVGPLFFPNVNHNRETQLTTNQIMANTKTAEETLKHLRSQSTLFEKSLGVVDPKTLKSSTIIQSKITATAIDQANGDTGANAHTKKNHTTMKVNKHPVTALSVPAQTQEMITDETSNHTKKNAGQGPDLAWLMSFPNSGTSFTLKTVKRTSGCRVATNYGGSHTDPSNGLSIPVSVGLGNLNTYGYEYGPYWTRDSLEYPSCASSTEEEQPLVLTKTHCGGRCTFCRPDRYMEGVDSFLELCLQTDGVLPVAITNGGADTAQRRSTTTTTTNANSNSNSTIIQYGDYNPARVKKAVHIVRDPFDNIVSRFHLYYKHRVNKDDKDWVREHPRDATGFQQYCHDQDSKDIEWEQKHFGVDFRPVFKNIPCHSEFLRYVQWHNLAIKVSRRVVDMDMEGRQNKNNTLVLYYEDYADNFNRTVDNLMSFLSMDRNYDAPTFQVGRRYTEYYTPEQRNAAIDLMIKASSDDALEILQRYF